VTVAVEGRLARRNVATISLVAAAHCTSHVMQLALPPLFPILHAELGASFIELGMIITLFYAGSGLGQAVAGVLVDRFGAARILVAGLALLSLSIAGMGFAPSLSAMLPLAVAAGLGNSVFHPADLSILSHRVEERMLGRAFAVHGITGALGYAVSPALVGAIAAYAGWRVALVAVGAAGLGIAVLLFANAGLLAFERQHATPVAGAPLPAGYFARIGSPILLLAFGFFVLTAYGGSGIQAFSITALSAGYGLSLELATLALTVYLVAGSLGMVMGGVLADRTTKHHRVAMTGLAVTALAVLSLALVPAVPALIFAALTVAGIANGTTGPSRDVLVRRAAIGTGMGSVFGFVYSGFDLGSATAPLLFGTLGDHQAWRTLFIACAIAFACAVPTVMQVERRQVARRATPQG
jgi:MFS transporter, FSR family, fosmidomycin resistance protein